ncbi:TIR domain-containing protein [Parasphingopyxis lamellibrachiae]|uniref:TIR domain-containing protein n=1 Tax=Parasphingopyxis lamellibrachiae TaxID=680125 RepID=A0A3D9FFN5_9SPHN|nr:TIR domain-containing protein [Parasphingopyxis lamellibrachiae]RED16372.1 TIR domain-containing protein [Parasphingopyxis lamellibrachiae]
MTDVFISYKREERNRCIAIYNALLDLRLSVWFDAHIDPGTSFDREIEREVQRAKAILVLWSRRAKESDWVRAEARLGKQGNRLAAVRLDDCILPLEFASVQTVDLFETDSIRGSEEWARVTDRIGGLVGRPGLGDFVRCEQSADAGRWQSWIDRFADVPLVPVAEGRLKALHMAMPQGSGRVPGGRKIPGAESGGASSDIPVQEEEEAESDTAADVHAQRTATGAAIPAEPPRRPADSEPFEDRKNGDDRRAHIFWARAREIAERTTIWQRAAVGAALAVILLLFLWPFTGAQNDAREVAAETAGEATDETPFAIDCEAIGDPGEQIVCDSEELRALDRQTAEQFGEMREGADEQLRTMLDIAQNAMIRQRNRCETTGCARSAYEEFQEQMALAVNGEDAPLEEGEDGESAGEENVETVEEAPQETEGERRQRLAMSLARNRLSSARSYLVARGVAASDISTSIVTESLAGVSTADGVRDQQARRIEITFGPDTSAQTDRVQQRQAGAPPPPPCESGPYLIFFDWEDAGIRPDAGAVLDAVAATYQSGRCPTRILMQANLSPT